MINSNIDPANLAGMMNVAATHDSPRLSTSLYNKNLYKYQDKPSDNPDYKINKPDELTRKEQELLLIHQFTFIGAPHIWNGDEVGMWGADDPDCRKPMVWSDMKYDDEKVNYDPEKTRPVDQVKPDTALLDFYKKLVAMRKANPVLANGSLEFIIVDDKKMVLAYSRKLGNDEIITVFNRSDMAQSVSLPVKGSGTYRNLLYNGQNNIKVIESGVRLTLEPLTAIVLKRN